jgi:hypothetical protein
MGGDWRCRRTGGVMDGRPCIAKVARERASEPEFEHDEVVTCMVLAFAIGNALLTIIYRLTG